MNKEAMDALMVVQNEEGFSNQHKFYLANLYEKQKRYQESTQLIMTIIDKEPLNAHAWNFIGYAILERGDEFDEAYKYIKKALDLNPDDGYIRDSLGWYYFKKGQISKALKEIEFAAKKVPDDLEILKHLAIIHKQMKNFKKSFEYYQEAMRYAKYPFERKQIVSGLEELNNLRMPASQKNNK
jgi:tetratricopeptide (TPR) repeat protein